MASLRWYPVLLDLRGVPCLVAGGGKTALRRVRGLLACGARVLAVAPEFRPPFARLRHPHLRRLRRPVRTSDLRGRRLVFACTDSPRANAALGNAARRRGVFFHRVDAPGGTLRIPAVVRRGRLVLAVSTGDPAWSRRLRIEWGRRLAKGGRV